MDQFLNKIATLGLTLEAQGNDLLLKGTGGKLSSSEIELIKKDAEIMTFIKSNKSELIAYLRGGNDTNDSKINKEDISALYELSPLQEGILFHSLYNPKSTAYKTQFSMEFPEGLNLNAFKKAWEYVIKNHTILRTSFIHDQLNIPIQCVYKKSDFNYDHVDYTHFEKEELEIQFEALLQNERSKEFDFKKPPLMRVTLVQVDSKAIRMIWTKHHILWDGWSGQILMKEFIQAYTTYTNNGVPPAREEDKFEEYIKYIKNINPEEEKSFWMSYLENFSEPSLFPFATNQIENQNTGGEYNDVYLNFDQPFTDKIIEYTKQANITVSTLLQGIWALLLSRYTSNDDIVFGVTVSGRPTETKYEEKIGLYINTIPFRAKIDENEAVSNWLQALQNQHVKAREFQHTALSSIKRYNNIQHGFFDTIFVFRNFPVNKFKEKKSPNDLEIQNYSVQENNNYPLSVQADLHEVLCVDFKFNQSIISEEYIQMVSDHFEYTLKQIINTANAKLKNINLVSDKEKHKLIHEFNDTAVSYPKYNTVLDLINQQVQQAPDQIVVEFEEDSLTYQELNEQSNQLANCLIHKGIKKGDLIGIYLERSLEMIIGLLGILKSGAAYVPIDPEYPEERVQYILDDINSKIVITTQKSSEKLSENYRQKCLNIDLWNELSLEPTSIPEVHLESSDLMYIIYTSGSTGKPKGVMNQHDGVLNRLLWAQDSYALNANDTVLQKTTFCFDVSVWELFLPLFTGAKLLFAKPEGHKDNVYLKEIIERKKVTTVHFVPSMLSVFLLELSPENCASMKTFVCSGEALQIHHINEFKRVFGTRNVRLQNLYGPTEAAIDVTFWEVPSTVGKVLIGKPVANTKIYILDQENNIQPIGVSGELCIGGIQVSRGYLNKEKLTEEKYVRNPFAENELLYRTGDLAKWTPDGDVEYIGRIDNQVKIRGYRIELGEIETVIQEFDQIQMASVLVKPGYQNHLQLIAFLVSKEKIAIESLKEYLKNRLPAYMIPTVIIQVESFPLTSNGKLDRKQLLASYEPEKVTYVAPETDHEKTIAGIWSELLNREEISVNDDFFLIGGDSILLIRMLTQLKKQFKKEINLHKVYEDSVLKNLAVYIQNQEEGNTSDARNHKIKELDAIKSKIVLESAHPEQIEDVYPMSDIQKGMVYEYYKNQKESVYHDQFVYIIPAIEPDTFHQAFRHLIQKHETLRTSFDITGFEGVQIVNKEVDFNVDFNDITHLNKQHQEEHIRTFLEEERKVKFDIVNAPLWRATVFKVSTNEMVYVFQFHHAILDGWSLASLNTELFEVYFKLIKNEGIYSEPLKTNNKSSIIDSLIDKDNKEYSDFWKNYLLSSERMDIFSEEETEDAYDEYFESAQIHELEKTAKEWNTTVKNILLGSYLYTLSLLRYEKDIMIGVVSNNRPMSEDGDKVLGCFLNTIPLRMSIGKSSTWKDLIIGLQENLNGLKGKDRLSLSHINKVVNNNSSLDNPFFDCIFNYVNFHIYENLDHGDKNQVEENNGEESTDSLDINSFENVNTHLIFTLSGTGGVLRGSFKLKRKFKSGITTKGFVANFKKVLHLIATKPDSVVSNFEVLSEEVQNRILHEFNDTQIPTSTATTLFEKFEEQATLFPDHIAVSYNQNHISYNDLNQEVNQFAHYLIKKYKIENRDVIGVKLERDENLLMAILGVLKTGAAYVPLDMHYPENRIDYIEKDSKCKLIVTKEELDLFKMVKGDFSNQNPSVAIHKGDLAYTIYTSGTTGLPKGVMISHSNALELINWAEKEFDSTSFQVVFASTSHCFDLSVFEMFYTLSIGKRIRILKDALQIEQHLDEKAILLNTVPSSIRYILEQGHDLKNVSVINLAGEIFPSDIAQKLASLAVEVRNLYGPTEDTTYSTGYKLSGKTYKTVPIGKPISNTKAFILDENLEIVPVGVEGQLYLSGAGLSLGYRNNPVMTEEKFIHHPNLDGLRMYNTGDIVKWLPDGNIEYLGRKDQQVKIRGFRIELGEIEDALLCYSEDLKQVVVDVNDLNGQKTLVAYYVSEAEKDTTEIRNYLLNKLPEYMVPGFYLKLQSLPLTPNGKIDRKALPSITGNELSKREYIVPRNKTEEKLVKMWQEVFRIEKVGVTDDFFELGGHSLFIVQIINRIHEEFGVLIQIKNVFSTPNIEGLSKMIDYVLLNEKQTVDSETEYEKITL
ncbi:amino acid adenylation domain-containing protein [Flavobacterium sp.]|uniref:amino acid adenylation domain-containing protein n=1 Tax=Flavobacterium sp. TaxID=239 RepID=UPI003D6A7655